MENLARKGPEVQMATIVATYPCNTIGQSKHSQQTDPNGQACSVLCWRSLELGKRARDYGLDRALTVGYAGFYTYTYAELEYKQKDRRRIQ